MPKIKINNAAQENLKQMPLPIQDDYLGADIKDNYPGLADMMWRFPAQEVGPLPMNNYMPEAVAKDINIYDIHNAVKILVQYVQNELGMPENIAEKLAALL